MTNYNFDYDQAYLAMISKDEGQYMIQDYVDQIHLNPKLVRDIQSYSAELMTKKRNEEFQRIKYNWQYDHSYDEEQQRADEAWIYAMDRVWQDGQK